MAKFLEKGMHGSAYTPPPGSGTVFVDVPLSYWAVDWIEKLYVDDITKGCQDANPACNAAQLLAENTINTVEPQLVDPANGDFHPTPEGNVFSVPTYAIPDFGWDDAPATPAVPPGDPNNRVPLDRDRQPRPWPGLPGAYTG